MLLNRKLTWWCVVALSTLLGPTARLEADVPFSEMVSFGASWEMERWSNGLAWPSWLASEIDISTAAATGQHYGQGCAGTSGWRGQVGKYLGEHTPDDTTLFTFAAGAGDYLRGCISSKPAIETSLNNVESVISQLVDAGGRHFMVPTFVYADVPLRADHEQVVELNTSLDALLPELEQTHGITIYRPDFYQLVTDVMTEPLDFGFTNIDDTVGRVPHEYVWFDPSHPTTAVHRLMGHTAFQTLGLAPDPDAVLLGNGENDYRQDFESLDRSKPAATLPEGWVGVTDGAMYTSLTGQSTSRVGSSGALIKTGIRGDRALGIGITRAADQNEIQLHAQLTDGNVNSVQLQFDLEAWGSNTGLAADPSEAAFQVVLEADQGDGFAPLADFGTLTTGAVLPQSSRVDGNSPENRLTFDSGMVPVELAGEMQLRVRWAVPAESQTTGWTFGLDNVALTLGLFGDFSGNLLLDVHDVDLLSAEVALGGPDLSFDLTGDDIVNGQDVDSLLGLANRLNGDTNFDGEVNFGDFLVLSSNFNQADKKWSEGDFDFNGIVGFPDFLILSSNFNQSEATATATAAVPEPSALLLGILGIIYTFRRRRKQRVTN